MWFALVLALVAPPAGSAEIAGERLRELRRAPVEAAAPGPWVERRDLSFEPVEGGLRLRGRWTIRSLGTGWFSGRLFAGAAGLRVVSARWGASEAALKVDGEGATIAGRVAGSVTLTVEAFVPGDPAQAAVALQLLPAVRGTIAAAAPEGLVAAVRSEGAPALAVRGTYWSGARDIELSFGAPPAPAADRPPMVVAKVGIGLTVGDAELRGRARAVWEVRHGEITGVALQTAGLGADLEVTGANLRGFRREGEVVRVELQSPVRDRVELELRWSAPLGKAAESRASLPSITPLEVFHGEVALQLARDGEVEAVPEAPGWSYVAAAALPGWAQGLVEGTATAALVRGGAEAAAGGSLSLLRFVPLEGPPVVVDVAAYTVATSREGRALVRAHYEVRNERAAHLRVSPPAGFRVIGVRVGGQTAAPARARDGGWIVPLLRSVETVQGLLSFPVEVILLGESTAWRRRETRTLPLPTLDAPVAVSRLTLHLPPGYRSRKRAGDGDVVAAFTRGEGITYGLGVGEVGAAQADAMFQDAVQAWLRNDFEAAQSQLDALRGMGANSENIARLQSNLDVVAGKSSGSSDRSLQRRVREQARARAYADVQAQAELKQKAEEARARGDYAASASSYQQALAVGDRLAQLEQAESVEQRSTNAALAKEFAAVQEKSKARAKRPQQVASRDAAPEFADEVVAGSMVVPEGAAVADGESAGEATPAPEPVEAEPNMPVARAVAEDDYAPEVVLQTDALVEARPVRGGLARRAASRRAAKRAAAPAPAPPSRRDFTAYNMPEETGPDVSKDSPLGGMPTPEVHASALSVVVPAVGEAVRYQRLLLPAGAAYAVEISAREPLIAKE